MLQNLLKSMVKIIPVVICLLMINQAQAHRNWHYGWGWGVGTGFIGGAVMAPHFPRPYYYQPFPPPVFYQQPIVVYEQPRVVAVAPAPVAPAVVKPAIWYFCESEKNFYPNVSSCSEPWKLLQTEPSSTYMPAVPPPPLSQ
jgi:hypothetical protein